MWGVLYAKEDLLRGDIRDKYEKGKDNLEGTRGTENSRGMEGGAKFPSGLQLGRINSVLELTLTPQLPPSSGPASQAKPLARRSRGLHKGATALLIPSL